MIQFNTISESDCLTLVHEGEHINKMDCSRIIVDPTRNQLLITIEPVTNNHEQLIRCEPGKDNKYGEPVEYYHTSTPPINTAYFLVYDLIKYPLVSAAFITGRATYAQFQKLAPVKFGCYIDNSGTIAVNLESDDVPFELYENSYEHVNKLYRLTGSEEFTSRQFDVLSKIFRQNIGAMTPYFCNPHLVDRDYNDYLDKIKREKSEMINLTNSFGLPGAPANMGMNGTGDAGWMRLQSGMFSGGINRTK